MFAAPLAVHASPTVAAPAATPSTGRSALAWLGAGALALGTIASMKDTGTIAKKFATRAAAATPDYTSGVTGAGARMEAAGKAAESSWEQGVNGAIARKSFAAGMNGSAAKYDKNASTLGAQRYGPGVQNATDAYAKGFQPYADRLKSLSLPPRGARRSPANTQRSTAVALALGALKEGR
jgi:hypothetical protein